MNKYEKALARYQEAWCWNPKAGSMADALTQMRRCKTQAFNEKNELYLKLSERYDRMLHISECSLSPMLAAEIVDNRHRIEAVVDSKKNQTMPKKNFMVGAAGMVQHIVSRCSGQRSGTTYSGTSRFTKRRRKQTTTSGVQWHGVPIFKKLISKEDGR